MQKCGSMVKLHSMNTFKRADHKKDYRIFIAIAAQASASARA